MPTISFLPSSLVREVRDDCTASGHDKSSNTEFEPVSAPSPVGSTLSEADMSALRRRNYKILIGAIQPRPIAWVSSRNESGNTNIAPFSFFNILSVEPMVVGFTGITTRDNRVKDSVLNAEREKAFVVNFVSEPYAKQANATSQEVDYGVSEIDLAGLTEIDSDEINAKGIKETKIRFECVLENMMRFGDGPSSGTLVAGRVVKIHMDADVIDDNDRLNTDQLQLVGRGPGSEWVRTDSRFNLPRPSG